MAANKANGVLGLIRRSFQFIDSEMMKQLYKGLVRPHLEYATAVSSPHYIKDSTLLENVQRRATKLVPEIRNLEYQERLQALDPPSLQYRRMRGDLIEAYKFTKGVYNVDTESLLPAREYTKTRGHEYKLEKQRGRLNLRAKFFSLRIRDAWSNLPAEIVTAPSLSSFKGRIDEHLKHLRYSTEHSLITKAAERQPPRSTKG